MATKGTPHNGHNRLEDALATLIQNQATFVGQQAAFVGQLAENNRLHLEFEREANQRVARIEAQMADVIRLLSEHSRQLERLTEAVRDKIGFKG